MKSALAPGRPSKTSEEIEFLRSLIERHGGIDYARRVARHYASRAEAALSRVPGLDSSVHREFLQGLIGFVTRRDH